MRAYLNFPCIFIEIPTPLALVTGDSNDWKCHSYVFPNYIYL